jgi:Tfp pilus assembly protein PilN
MAARKKKEEEINLLPQKGFQSSTAGRVLAWILSTFRIIVIVTEIIVMIAFLSRFWFDAQNTNLNEQIQQKKDVLLAYQNFEHDFKDVQKRLKIYSDITQDKVSGANVVEMVKYFLPPDVVATEISDEKNAFEVIGETSNERNIQQLIVNLNSATIFKDTSLTGVNTRKDNPSILIFTISSKIVPEKGK